MASQSVSFSEKSSYSQPHSSPFRDQLGGEGAFYNQPNYLEKTREDFVQKKFLSESYVWNTESRVVRIAKLILSIIIFPIGIYQLLHAIGGIALVPASILAFFGYLRNYPDHNKIHNALGSCWKYKRITLKVDGYKIDGAIMGEPSTLNNGRWVLFSGGNGEFYESQLFDDDRLKKILKKVKGNGILFNYPGVKGSSGFPNREAMAKAYRAVLCFLEDERNGVGAKVIIGYGYSIGGGVQGEALKTHELKKGIKYIFVKDRTFSDLSSAASALTTKLFGFFIKILRWNIDSVESSKKLKAVEIIMQTACVGSYQELHDSSKIVDDGVIFADASLAKALLDDTASPRKNKIFIGIPERHNEPLRDFSFLTEKIEPFLKT